MKLLVVSNYYPPCFVGGYELGCRDVVEQLRTRGHRVTVLTSNYCSADTPPDRQIRRYLHVAAGKSRPMQHLQHLFVFLRAVIACRPRLIYFWNQTGLSSWLAPVANLLGFRTAFFLSDLSFRSWRVGAFLRKYVATKSTNDIAERLRRQISEHLRGSVLVEGHQVMRRSRCHFASRFIGDAYAQQGTDARDGKIIYWGIDPEVFRYAPHSLSEAGPAKLLCAGQIIPEKGVHTLLDAVALIVKQSPPEAVTLTVVGGSSNTDYLAQLKTSIRERHLEGVIRFTGRLDRSDLPSMYHAHDILIMPSIWDEPFAITPLEAMACGVPVVATPTGGSAEIFVHRQNSMIFRAGDAEACAEAIIALRDDRLLYDSIRESAHKLVLRRFTIDEMVSKIATDLDQLASGRPEVHA